jgi:hypothetical protein
MSNKVKFTPEQKMFFVLKFRELKISLAEFWTIKGIILQNSVLPNFITGFAPTNRTQYPFAFHHN